MMPTIRPKHQIHPSLQNRIIHDLKAEGLDPDEYHGCGEANALVVDGRVKFLYYDDETELSPEVLVDMEATAQIEIESEQQGGDPILSVKIKHGMLSCWEFIEDE